MDVETYRERIKTRLSVDTTDFDTDIDTFVNESVDALYPMVMDEASPEEVSIGTNDTKFDLPAGIDDVKRIEYKEGRLYLPFQGVYHQHGSEVIFESAPGNLTLRVYGLSRYSVTEVPSQLQTVVINWAMSEFYSMLVGNKRKYNIYAQSSGARSADNMRDLSDYYLDRGNQTLNDRARIHGA